MVLTPPKNFTVDADDEINTKKKKKKGNVTTTKRRL